MPFDALWCPLTGDFETAYFEIPSTVSNRSVNNAPVPPKDNLEDLLAKLKEKDVELQAKLEEKDAELQAKTAESVSMNREILLKVGLKGSDWPLEISGYPYCHVAKILQILGSVQTHSRDGNAHSEQLGILSTL